jgi:hypothetical protein
MGFGAIRGSSARAPQISSKTASSRQRQTRREAGTQCHGALQRRELAGLPKDHRSVGVAPGRRTRCRSTDAISPLGCRSSHVSQRFSSRVPLRSQRPSPSRPRPAAHDLPRTGAPLARLACITVRHAGTPQRIEPQTARVARTSPVVSGECIADTRATTAAATTVTATAFTARRAAAWHTTVTSTSVKPLRVAPVPRRSHRSPRRPPLRCSSNPSQRARPAS